MKINKHIKKIIIIPFFSLIKLKYKSLLRKTNTYARQAYVGFLGGRRGRTERRLVGVAHSLVIVGFLSVASLRVLLAGPQSSILGKCTGKYEAPSLRKNPIHF